MREPKYYRLEVVWASGFTHYVPVTGYNLKSQLKFQESLSPSVKSFSYKEIPYKEYYKMVWGEYPEEPKKTRRKKVLDK
jgi:hypothetical protein